LSRASSEATRWSPRPGWAIEKATIRSSTIFGSALGIWGAPALARTQHLEPVALDLGSPAVVGRAVDAERATGLGDGGAPGQGEDLLAVAEQGVIIGHATRSFCTWR
jgi:hypothetical protein